MKSQSKSPEFELSLQLFETQDSLSMARLFAAWAVKHAEFTAAELIWPDRLGKEADPARIERLGKKHSRSTPKLSLRFRDENAVFFRITFFAEPKTKISASIHRELTAASRFVERMILANEKRQLNEELRRFHWIRHLSAGLSHELNTPFTTLQFHLKKLGPQGPLERPMATISRVLNQYQNLSGDGTTAEPQSVTAQNLIEGLRQRVANHFPGREGELKVTVTDPGAQISVRIDDIHRALIELVSNAFHAVAQTPHERVIEIRTQVRRRHLRITVTDNGSGISIEDRPFVFAPFFTKKDVSQGSGMGLSLARAIAFMHDGSLTLNHLSQQTQFVLELPLLEESKAKRKAA